MHKLMILAAASAAVLALGGCQSVLKNLETCERHYNGTVSGGTVSPAILAGQAKIDCCPVGYVANGDHSGCVKDTVAPLSTGDVVGGPPTTK